MKQIKHLLLLAVIILPFLQSCGNVYDPQSYAIVTIKTSDAKDYYFTLDSGKTIYPGDKSRMPNFVPKDGVRAIIYFTELTEKVSGYDYNVMLYNIETILTKDIVCLQDAKYDTLGTDEVELSYASISGGYLNVEFKIYSAGGIMHSVNLVDNQLLEWDGENTLLEFRHQANGDYKGTLAKGMVCFKLGQYDPAVTSKKITLRVNTYSGSKDYVINK
ncbi:MAG: NigD-like protein [Bacteroidales bacterium]|nr:NigD-like protein [Bacteroidales bacterium]MDD4670254.1 NigD-like protein [Bacteroidales bacterium]